MSKWFKKSLISVPPADLAYAIEVMEAFFVHALSEIASQEVWPHESGRSGEVTTIRLKESQALVDALRMSCDTNAWEALRQDNLDLYSFVQLTKFLAHLRDYSVAPETDRWLSYMEEQGCATGYTKSSLSHLLLEVKNVASRHLNAVKEAVLRHQIRSMEAHQNEVELRLMNAWALLDNSTL